jgi:hypothetical protein
MKLVRKYTEPGASVLRIQLEHRRDAVAHALECIGWAGMESRKLFHDDALYGELDGTWREWIKETLYQGAYMREYHLWEKDCKDYFAAMAQRNSAPYEFKKGPVVKEVERALTLFHVTIPITDFEAVREMNRRVNIMKHEPGLALEHFITAEDYETATSVIGRFWETLASIEEIDYR